ncbi:MAG: hypothetical protein AAF404_03975 [Pseudomonadota bacterium]
MSVIAHWIENLGISTVVIGLIKEHMAKIQPPRALWVPFELGRPMGPPNHAAFQQQVLLSALDTVATPGDRAVLKDFTHDDPRGIDNPDWQPPLIDTCQRVQDEVNALQSYYNNAVSRMSRTSVGVSQISITECATLLDEYSRSAPSRSLRDGVSPILMARYAIDDLKSFYIEAALADAAPSSTQVYHWFWLQTHLGNTLRQLRLQWMNANSSKLKNLGEKFIVPHRWRSP